MTDHVKSARLTLAIGITFVALMGCSQAPDNNGTSIQAPRNSVAQHDPSGPDRRLAISHSFTLRLPSTEIESVQSRHLAECRRLGCTILSTHLDRSNEGRISARSSLRISPEGYAAFATAIAAPPASVVSHSETAEDKFVPMLDIEKRLAAKIALRDRLTALMQDPAAKSTAEIISVEKELAQVQGDIEAATAQHDHLRKITETVRVDINYTGQAVLVGGFDFSPVTRAINGLGPTFLGSAATLISFLAAILPWLPLAAFVVWAVRRAFRRWKRPALA